MHTHGHMQHLLLRGLIAVAILSAVTLVGCVRTTRCAQLAPVLAADPPVATAAIVSDEP